MPLRVGVPTGWEKTLVMGWALELRTRHRAAPRVRQEVVLDFRVFEGQVIARPVGTPGWRGAGLLSPRPHFVVESCRSPPPARQKSVSLLQVCSLSSLGLRSTACLPDKPEGDGADTTCVWSGNEAGDGLSQRYNC